MSSASALQQIVTGERVVTSAGGFNPTWQRHVATYRLCAPLLPADGPVLDLGCGIGHSHDALAPRPTVGIDLFAEALRGQSRPVARADMRRLPFRRRAFRSILSIQSIEHVRDPNRVVAEAARVLDDSQGDAVAIFATPNRLNFGRPDEIIDPYHFIEFDAAQLRDLLLPRFTDVTLLGLRGSPRHLAIHYAERRKLDRLLALDPLRARRLVPLTLKRRLYDWQLTRSRRVPHPSAAQITPEDFYLASDRLDECLDLIAIARSPRA